MSERKLTIIIGGDAKGGVKALNDTEHAAGGMGSKMASAGKMAALGVVAVGAAAIGIGAKCANTFAQVGGEVAKLVRFTGATAEEASRLRFAGAQAGLGVDDLTKSLGLLSKNAVGTKLDKLGLDLKDADGHVKPLNESLLTIADRFQSMPNGAEKTALAMQLFGRSGAAMIPFLNRGAEGIAELEKQSDKLGNTLSQKDLDAVKQSTANHRLFTAAMQGLQIQIGRYVLPIVTQFTSFMAGNLPKAFGVVTAAAKAIAPVFQLIVGAMTTVLGTAQQMFDVLAMRDFHGGGIFQEDSPIISRLFDIRDAITGFVDRVKVGIQQFMAAWHYGAADFVTTGGGISNFILQLGETAHKFFSFLGDNAKPILIGLGAALLLLISPVAAIGAALVLAYTHFEGFRNIVNAVVQFLVTQVLPIIATFAMSMVETFTNLAASVAERWAAISEAISHVVNAIRDVITPVISVIAALWRAWGDDLVNITATVFGYISASIQNAITVITGIIDVFLAVINGDWGAAWNGIKEIVAGVWAQIQNVISTALSIIQSVMGGVLSTIGQVWNGAWNGIKGTVSGAIDSVVGFVTKLPGRIASGVAGAFNAIPNGFRSAMNALIKIWNNFRIHFGGYDIPGPGPNIPSFTIDTPDIPYFAKGGIVRKTLGGVLGIMGEAGSDEAVIPLNTAGLRPLIDGIVTRMRALAAEGTRAVSYGGTTTGDIHLHLDLTGAVITQGVEHLVETLRPEIERVLVLRNAFG